VNHCTVRKSFLPFSPYYPPLLLLPRSIPTPIIILPVAPVFIRLNIIWSSFDRVYMKYNGCTTAHTWTPRRRMREKNNKNRLGWIKRLCYLYVGTWGKNESILEYGFYAKSNWKSYKQHLLFIATITSYYYRTRPPCYVFIWRPSRLRCR